MHNNTSILEIQWLYKASCFVRSLLLTDSFILRNRQLFEAINICATTENEHC